jgi:hypothetical protein
MRNVARSGVPKGDVRREALPRRSRLEPHRQHDDEMAALER